MVKKDFAAGFDIGGTKCAVIIGKRSGTAAIDIVTKSKFATADFRKPESCIMEMCRLLECMLAEHRIEKKNLAGIGISCGGPLDSKLGVIQSPPNLPGWDNIPVVEIVTNETGLPAKLENDANACALAEWKFGAGRGTENMIFLTFGTGLGAGIIANGQLISGHSGMAGECGHIRLAPSGPVGYGKSGSFEGFCSGGGIAQLGRLKNSSMLNAKIIADAAENGDADAIAVYEESGRRLGQGLSILIDLLNPERIVIGSIFARSENLFRPTMEQAIAEEALPQSAAVCKIVSAQLGEAIGDMASLSLIL